MHVLNRFFRSEPAPGLLLIVATLAALVVANTSLFSTYDEVLHDSVLGLSVHAWINDALMAVFFLLVGLEIKRELVGGELATWASRVLPGIAALSGMIVPAIIFLVVARGDATIRDGWAIPTATDIAFALGILSLLGSRVPGSLKLLLTSIAILDDLGAIVVIAVFYTSDIAMLPLGGAALLIVGLIAMNRRGVMALWPYLALGAALWYCVFESGIHATLAGVIVAMTIPTRHPVPQQQAPLHRLEHAIDTWVSFAIVPLFAFANAGVRFSGLNRDDVIGQLPIGIALGLFLGKQIGIFGAIWGAAKLGLAQRPAGARWIHVYGMAVLCGIGFTMSLFIGGLAYADSEHFMGATRVGVLAASLISATVGSLVLIRAPSAEK